MTVAVISRRIASLLLSCAVMAAAQAPPSFKSTEIHKDGTVTFRFYDPHASKAALVLENHADWIAMQRGADGIWSVTTEPLPPEIYGYRFALNGGPGTVHDPQATTHRYGNDLLLIPGNPPQPWEDAGAPKGAVERHSYTSKIVANLPQGKAEYVVYTPPGYNKTGKPYPILYLLHVWGDYPGSWMDLAQANLILDNLIAAGKARPMVVVMPLSYGDMRLASDYELGQNPAFDKRNRQLFEQALLTELMPKIEADYNVRRDADGRAIMGASMGGQESLLTGLRYPDRFAWIGGESSALKNIDFDVELAGFPTANRRPRKVWIVCGTRDELLEGSRRLEAWLKAKGQPVTLEVPEGTHSYIIWREGLVRFAQMIFRAGG